MLRKLTPFQAFGSFKFKDPDTGHIYHAPTLSKLYGAIISYRAQNNLEQLENLNDVVENYLCGLPENCNRCTPVELHRSFMTYVRGGIALIKNMAFKKYVSQEVADKRAKQCEGCKFNVFPDQDVFPAWADNVAVMSVGDRKASNADKLGNCEVCTCNLKSKVFYDGTLDKFSDEEVVKLKSVNCWQLKLSGQDKE